MANKKKCFSTTPVESHETAAWMESFEKVKPDSQVLIPTDLGVENAKEWVDSNQL